MSRRAVARRRHGRTARQRPVRIRWSPAATALARRYMRDQDGMRAVGTAVAALADDPYPAEGFHRGRYHRLRVGPYRVMYVIDPEAVRMDLGAQCERAAAARGAVQDRVGGELRGDQDRLVGPRAAAQPPGQRGPRELRPAGARRGRFRCAGGCPPPRLSWSQSLSLGPDLCFTACRAGATVGNGIGPDAH